MEYIIATNSEGMNQACDYFMKQEVVGFDLETTELNPRDGDIRLAQVSDGERTVILDLFQILDNAGRREASREENFEFFSKIKVLLESFNTKKVIHFSQFESKWCRATFDSDINGLFDTFLASKLINYSLFRHSLSAVAREYLKIDLDKTEQRSDWSRPELTKEQYDYAALDVFYSKDLRKVMLQRLVDDDLLRAARIDFESAIPISHTEQSGLNVNRGLYTDEIENLVELHKVASESLQDKLRETKPNMGIQQSMFDIPEKNYSDVLLTSSTQMLEALVKLGVPVLSSTETEKIEEYQRKGKLFAIGTGSKALTPLEGQYPIIRLLSDFRGVEKMVSSFGTNFLKHLVQHSDGERVHTSYSIIGAPTGRMSSRDPNTQQIPDKIIRVGEEEHSLGFRKAFDFPEGRIGVNADYSQIELRIAAEFSKCPVFTGAFVDGRDLHATTASIIWGAEYEFCADEKHEYYKKYRKPSKSVNFGIAYGQGPMGLAAQLNIPYEEAKEIIDKHREAHPVLWAYLDKQSQYAIRTLTARTASGRLQRFNKPTLDANGFPDRKEQSAIGRNGKNMPIQGCVAGDTRILVADQGYVKIGDAPKEKQQVWDEKNLVNAFVAESGLKQLTHVNFQGGHKIDSSPEHKFWAKRKGNSFEWIEAKNLKSGDKIELGKPTVSFDYLDRSNLKVLSKINSTDIGHLIAIAEHSGKIVDDVLRIETREKDVDLHNLLKKIFSNLGLTWAYETVYDKQVKVVFSAKSQELHNDLIHFMPYGKLDERFWTSKELMLGYLRGTFEFANLAFENVQLRVTKGRAGWAKDIQDALYLFGVKASIINGLTYTMLVLNGSDAYRYFKRVGVISTSKTNKAIDLQGLKDSARLRYGMSLTVSSVEVTDEMVEMFDVVDSDTSTFMANGLVTHNTSADILKRSLRLLYDNLKGMDAKIVNIVHDEITVECKEDIKEEVQEILATSMRMGAEEYLTRVPVVVDAKIIKNGDK